MLAEFWGKTSLWKEVAFAFWVHRSTLSLTSQVPQPLLWYNIRYSWGTLSLNMDQLLTRLPVWAPSTGLLIIKDLPITKSEFPKLLPPPPLPKKERKLTIRKNHLRNHFWPIKSGFSAIAMCGISLLYFSIYLVGWSLVMMLKREERKETVKSGWQHSKSSDDVRLARKKCCIFCIWLKSSWHPADWWGVMGDHLFCWFAKIGCWPSSPSKTTRGSPFINAISCMCMCVEGVYVCKCFPRWFGQTF